MIRMPRSKASMDCAAVEKVMQRFVDGELDAGRVERVDVHLATCDWCQHEADEFRALKAALARGTAKPADAAARLRALGHELLRDD